MRITALSKQIGEAHMLSATNYNSTFRTTLMRELEAGQEVPEIECCISRKRRGKMAERDDSPAARHQQTISEDNTILGTGVTVSVF